ncbi:MAG: phage tail protein [Sphingomonas bacterium]|jgi:phage tail-like protein|uniref:phage tail protein n=1 Tax=Sphingomonas bacterium TaxID=1895847 RepID=UPI002607F0D8|nr:phage tail protein [Sphingomonas bacterium]MDB5706035.1 phage tail protein [Sphingomonas bacterium]
MPVRDTPFGAYNFLVEFDGNDAPTSALGGFSDVSGIGTEITLMEYRQGNDKENRVRKIPGLHKAGDVTLKRGIMGQTNFLQWVNITRVDPTHKRSVTITLQNEQRVPILRWRLINARPMKFTGPTLAAKGGSDVAMEELVLAAEGFEFEEV